MANGLPDSFFSTFNSFTKTVHRDVYAAVDPKSPSQSQKGKVVMITGASKGIGRHGISDAFAHAGARAIIITARNVSALAETEAIIKKANPEVEVLALSLEVTNEESVQAAFEAVKARFGTIDVLVNNAGSYVSVDMFIGEADSKLWWQDMEVNVKGTFLVTKHFLKLIGKDKSATLINLSSGAGLAVLPGQSAYSISKLADLHLTSYTAAENPNVTAVALHPGIVMTDMQTPFFTPFAKDTPELAGANCVWLSTDVAKFMHGRYMSTNWSVDEILEKKEDIVSRDLLKIKLTGDFVTGEVKD